MGHDPVELETRLARCERAVFGDDDSSEGLSARMKMLELNTMEIRENFKRLNWLLITGVVVGLLNLLLSRGPVTHGAGPHQSTSVITGDAATSAITDEDTAEELAQTRGYYLTADIARKWGKSPKTITDWINQSNARFSPAPIQHGREWRFDLQVTETPAQTAAISHE